MRWIFEKNRFDCERTFMNVCHRGRERRGATVVEFSLVAPVVFFIFFAQLIGGLGIFRYQEVAHLARDGARYASTHGGMYQLEGVADASGVPQVAASGDLTGFVRNKAVLLNPNYLQVNVSWTAPSGVSPVNMPTYVDTDPNLVPPGQTVIQNYVIVTVRYQWFPQMYLTGPIVLSSTSKMPMTY
jgi:hypothetical protein